MDAYVQFVRNALCCIKDWEIFSETLLYDPSYTAQFYKFPEPLNQTTPLEVLIGITQFYAFVSCSLGGIHLMTKSGLWKLRRIHRLLELRKNDGDKKKEKSSAASTMSEKFINESLSNEGEAAIRSVFVGALVFSIGVSFFWLFANSFHVTSTDWIGGVQGLIHALTVMEIALVPLLYYMIKDAAGSISKAGKMTDLASKLEKNGGKMIKDVLSVENYGCFVEDGWSPFWSTGVTGSAEEIAAEEKMLTKESEAVQSKVESLLSEKVSAAVVEGTVNRLHDNAWMSRMEGYREYVYFLLNFIAFYGYLLGVLVFYFDDEEFQPSYVGSMKMGLSNADADWNGNFAGDLMWTVEPVIILASPTLISQMKPKKAKVKAA